MEWESAVAGAAIFTGAILIIWGFVAILLAIIDDRIVKLVKRPALGDAPFVFRLAPDHEYVTKEEVREMIEKPKEKPKVKASYTSNLK